MSGRWVPVSTDFEMRAPMPSESLPCSSRFELQSSFGSGSETSIIGKGGHFSVAKTCGRRPVVGLELGAVDRPTSTRQSGFNDQTFGQMTMLSIKKFRTRFGNAFIEIPLGQSRFHPHVVGSAGLHSTTTEKAVVYRQVTEDYAAAFALGQRYPQQNVDGTTRALGAGIGLKSWVPLGPNFAAGLGARVHFVGKSKSMLLESGVSVAYRP
jgi:hypothetical protein